MFWAAWPWRAAWGWLFSLSNEVYFDLAGVCYKNDGVPVDYALGYTAGRQAFFNDIANHLAQDNTKILAAISALRQSGDR